MKDPYKFYLTKLNLKEDVDNKIKRFYDLCYEIIWDLFTLDKNKQTEKNLVRSFLYHKNEELFNNFFSLLIKDINSKLEDKASIKNQTIDEYIMSMQGIPEEYNQNDPVMEEFINEWLAFPKSIFDLIHVRLKPLSQKNNALAFDIEQMIGHRNLENLKLLNEKIKSVLFEKTIYGDTKLSSISVRLFKNILNSALEQFKINMTFSKLATEDLLEIINNEFYVDWKLTTFKRYLKENRIDWKQLAKSKSIEISRN